MLSRMQRRALVGAINLYKKFALLMYRLYRNPKVKRLFYLAALNASRVPVHIFFGRKYLEKKGNLVTLGLNEKKVAFKGNTAVLQSRILLPYNHIFDSNGNITRSGLMTLFHELSHIPLDKNTKIAFYKAFKADPDELVADILATKIAGAISEVDPRIIRVRDIAKHLKEHSLVISPVLRRIADHILEDRHFAVRDFLKWRSGGVSGQKKGPKSRRFFDSSLNKHMRNKIF